MLSTKVSREQNLMIEEACVKLHYIKRFEESEDYQQQQSNDKSIFFGGSDNAFSDNAVLSVRHNRAHRPVEYMLMPKVPIQPNEASIWIK